MGERGQARGKGGRGEGLYGKTLEQAKRERERKREREMRIAREERKKGS